MDSGILEVARRVSYFILSVEEPTLSSFKVAYRKSSKSRIVNQIH
jgi:hypothetical protein